MILFILIVTVTDYSYAEVKQNKIDANTKLIAGKYFGNKLVSQAVYTNKFAQIRFAQEKGQRHVPSGVIRIRTADIGVYVYPRLWILPRNAKTRNRVPSNIEEMVIISRVLGNYDQTKFRLHPEKYLTVQCLKPVIFKRLYFKTDSDCERSRRSITVFVKRNGKLFWHQRTAVVIWADCDCGAW